MEKIDEQMEILEELIAKEVKRQLEEKYKYFAKELENLSQLARKI